MATKKSTKSEPKEEFKINHETIKEEMKVKGGQLIETVKKLIHEGNVRSIAIKDKNRKTIVKFPLTVGVVGAAIAPVLAAVGAIAALVTDLTITVERNQK